MNYGVELLLILVGPIAALGFAFYLMLSILKEDEGTDKMIEIAQAVREGAAAYLKRQYKGVAVFFAVVFVILMIAALSGYMTIFVPFAFLTGGLFSGLAGFCGMKIATQASARTANACQKSLNSGLRVAFSSGAVMGLVVVGFGLLDLTVWYFSLDWYYTNFPLPAGLDKITAITSTMLCFGMGASFQALFARVGGGIFTKAADVGADLVGKVEAGIPEDDPRNPATIADNVGDNVGDVAGMGADLYESYVGSIVATAALGVAAGFGIKGVLLPMVLASVGVLAAILGTYMVKAGEDASQKALLAALHKGILSSTIIVIAMSLVLVQGMLGDGSLGVWAAIVTGLVAGLGIGFFTEYFTSAEFKPTQKLAETALTGPATIIISGLSIGMLSTVLPIIIVCIAVLLSYGFCGGFSGEAFGVAKGLYGIGIAAVGMLSTLGITLATDAYGPVADNAGGNAEMAGLDPEVRKKTDALDSLGNTTAATGKGFAIGSAALTALALIAAYKGAVILNGGEVNLNLMNPVVLIGIFIGTMMPYLFAALTMSAVGRAAMAVVVEVRRQFKIPGIMDGTKKPDYASCVDIVATSAQREMQLPAIIAVVTPVLVGLLLGVNAVGGLLIGATASGFVLAIMMANAGGSWDNAKKYIEEGHHDGKGSDAHKAAVVGDTVGDPFKDTSGPAINILIKLMSMVSIVFVAFVVKNSLL